MIAGNPDISIIIVSYNSEKTIVNCLKSIHNNSGNYSYEIVLIDNNSSDQTTALADNLLASKKSSFFKLRNIVNLGFTRAVNQGLAYSTGKYILLLNPDTVLHAGFFDLVARFMDSHPEAGMVAPQHLSDSGEVNHSCRNLPKRMDIFFSSMGLSRLFYKNRYLNSWKLGNFDHRSTREVPQPMGACLFTRREDFERVGYLDERFYMFFSDVDWCRRFLENGRKIFFLADAKITHKKGHSIDQVRNKMILSSHRAFAQYFRKYNRGLLAIIPNFITFVFLAITALGRVVFRLGVR